MKPLAERMRPTKLDEFVGQQHLMGEDAALRKQIDGGHIHSCIFWGPPGVGKTSLALLLARHLDKQMYSLSAINAGVKDIREIIERAKTRDLFNTSAPILFIDEIHRFNKSQQDALLEAVEKGIITLIGATTENPSFEVNNALLSRCQVYILQELEVADLKELLKNAVTKDTHLLRQKITISEFDALFYFSRGDARKLYNLLELVVANVSGQEEVVITNQEVENLMLSKSITFDKGGEMHYDIISAFIKSVRGSHPDASVYWMARMLSGGEDPIFICRRMVILAAEDIGLANPNALLIANACMDAVHKIGMPEGRIVMSECAIYLANSPKSNTAYKAIIKAYEEVQQSGDLPVPFHLRNAPTKLMEQIGYGKDYVYPHDYPANYISQQYLPDKIIQKIYYVPGQNQAEFKMTEELRLRRSESKTKDNN